MFSSSFFTSNGSIGSCEASFHSEAVVHIYAKPIRRNAKIKRCHRRTQVFMNVFDVHFSSFPFRLFACKSTFVSLETACKTIPEIPDALTGQTCKLKACNVFQNIRFNGSRETRVSSLETRLSSRKKRYKGWYSAAQIYPNYAYSYYTLVFCVYAYVYMRIRVCQYARICPFVMHSHKFLCMKHCWSNKGHMGMKRLQSEICILLKRHADQ